MKLIAEKRQSIAFSKMKIAAQKIFEKLLEMNYSMNYRHVAII